jgi:opacity protein-like surface antigen
MMSERVKVLSVVAAFLLLASPAAAQVGHQPARSPYLDLEYNQELTLIGGYVRARHDPAGVAPLSRPLIGVRYEWGITGPLAVSAEVNGAPGERNVLDPTKPVATRSLGKESNAVLAADLALAMNLTGRRSWHRLVPQVRAGVGFLSSRAKDDSSGFAFGTPFAFTFGGGVKYVPGGRMQIRADITDRIFKLSYPDAYYRTTSDNTAVLPVSTARSFYTHHTALTVGVSYLFSR